MHHDIFIGHQYVKTARAARPDSPRGPCRSARHGGPRASNGLRRVGAVRGPVEAPEQVTADPGCRQCVRRGRSRRGVELAVEDLRHHGVRNLAQVRVGRASPGRVHGTDHSMRGRRATMAFANRPRKPTGESRPTATACGRRQTVRTRPAIALETASSHRSGADAPAPTGAPRPPRRKTRVDASGPCHPAARARRLAPPAPTSAGATGILGYGQRRGLVVSSHRG